MEKRLTKEEVDCFKHGLPGDSKIMNGLMAVFWFPWGAWMIFLLYMIFNALQTDKGKDSNTLMVSIELFLGFGAAAIFMIVCMRIINKRNERIYQKLKNGEYRLIVSTVSAKDFRYQGSGKSRCKVEFYKCPEIRGEITPISKKQFKHAKVGDPLKVIIIDNMWIVYGILDQ